MVKINRIYVENYKLFAFKEVDFRNALLSIFDGPNGYGKTSIFDAIELLITGEISRVKDSEAIDGKRAYETVFLAKDTKKDVIIKGEFEDENKEMTLVLVARVSGIGLNGKQINPKNIFADVEYYILPSYDIEIDKWDEYLISRDNIGSVRESFFGKQNLEKFTLFHYIRQEDRLAYFRQNEKARSSTIESLLGVESERSQYKKMKVTYKEIGDRLKVVEAQMSKIETRLEKKPEEVEGDVEYTQILGGKFPWDLEKLKFDNTNSEHLLMQFNRELDEVSSYITNRKYHNLYFSLEKYKLIPEQFRKDSIDVWILLHERPMEVESIENSYNELLFFEKQKKMLDLQQYLEVDFTKISEKLNMIDIGLEFVKEVVALKEIFLSQSDIQKTINDLISIRENLHKEYHILGAEVICPYCGHNWQTVQKLEEGYKDVQAVLESLLQRDGKKYNEQVELMKKFIDEKYLPVLTDKIINLSQDALLTIYGKFNDKSKFINIIENCSDIMAEIYGKVANCAEASNKEPAELAFSVIENLSKELPEDYLKENAKYDFKKVRDKYNLCEENLTKLSCQIIENKKKYIKSQFYKSFDNLQKEIDELRYQKNVLTEIKGQLKLYFDAIDRAIEKYKKQIIDEIEIPFFIYSSRLLQSYQGGQGVFMENDGETIRFNAPDSEHDVLYTMSSGQLSAVLLAFSLAMNKIYAGDGIKTMFIDDPIQCMDDINMISFVELLRREFGEYQIILSTHEEDFSNFIRYKFGKYGLETKTITLKET